MFSIHNENTGQVPILLEDLVQIPANSPLVNNDIEGGQVSQYRVDGQSLDTLKKKA
jgi:hypothetical protein